MYDVKKVISIVFDALYAEQDMEEYCRELKIKEKIPVNETIWIPALEGSKAHRLGVLYERAGRMWREIADICSILNIDQNCLIASVKAMRRWEKHNGLYDRVLNVDSYSENGACLVRFLHIRDDVQYYKSTGRKKAWC